MKKSMLVMAMVIALAMSTIVTAFAGGSADKATGDMSWIYQDVPKNAVFNAHEARDNRPAKGNFFYEETDAVLGYSSFYYDVDWAEIEGSEGCFSGIARDTTGRFSDGQRWITKVVDGGEPGVDVDTIINNGMPANASDEALSDKCASIAPGSPAVSGNIQVHADGAHTS